MTQDEVVGWHHRHNGQEFEHPLRVDDKQGSLVCCNPRGFKELDRTEQLNNNENDNNKRAGMVSYHQIN